MFEHIISLMESLASPLNIEKVKVLAEDIQKIPGVKVKRNKLSLRVTTGTQTAVFGPIEGRMSVLLVLPPAKSKPNTKRMKS